MTTPKPPVFDAHTREAIAKIIASMLAQRVATFQINYHEKKRITNVSTFMRELINGTDDPHQHAVSRYQISTTAYATKTELVLEIEYRENSQQLSYVNQSVAAIIARIINPGMHVHQKMLAIHDWVTTHVRYDESLQRRTAYDALRHHTTVCSGFASLYWHLCTAVAIPCRIVTGVGKFEAHAWNMVKVETQWYHVDSTWGIVADSESPFSAYRFYLLTDKEIQQTHRITLETGQKAFPPANLQYRVQLQQLGRSTPRLQTMVHQIMHKTGLAYLEPEYLVADPTQLRKRIMDAIHKRQTRILLGYRGDTNAATQAIRTAFAELRGQTPVSVALSAAMYPMPHGFVAHSVLVEITCTYT